MKIKFFRIVVLFSLLVGASSFIYSTYSKNEVETSTHKLDPYYYWFRYTGPYPGTYWDAMDEDNYEIIPSPEEEMHVLCDGFGALCAIHVKRYWNGFMYKPDFSDTSYGNTSQQILEYYGYGLVGTAIIEKYY
jgi:hypothetical protein